MEEVGSDMKDWELKHSSLEKAFENFHSCCNKTEDHFNSTRNSFEAQFRELKAREEKLELREKQLEEKESCFESLRESKEDELDAIEEVITEKLIQVDQVKAELESVSLLVEEKRQELDSKESGVLELEKLVREYKRECELIQSRVEERTRNLRSIEEVIGEMDMKVESYILHEKSMELWSHKLDLKKNELEGISNKLQLEKELLDQKIRELYFQNDRAKHCFDEAELKEKHVDLLEESVKAEKQHLAALIKTTEERKQHLDSLQKIVEGERNLDSLSAELQRDMGKLSQQSKNLELKQTQFEFQLNTEQSEHAPLANKEANPLSGNNVTNILSSHAKTKEIESSMDTNLATFLFPNVQPHDTSDVDAIITLLGLISQNKRVLELCYAHGFAVKIADFILILIQKKHTLEAVRFIFTFKLIDKLPPIPLLKEYVEDTKKYIEVLSCIRIAVGGKAKAVDNLIGYLRAVHQCIKDYKPDSEVLSADIEMQIVKLEKLKKNWRLLASSISSNDKDKEKRKWWTYSRRVSTRTTI